jgi:catechol 2,3-dioxygenase-like lactoylglutathione lyase family enzyme
MSDRQPLITGVDFVALPTRDVLRAVDFYEGTLGLRRAMLDENSSYAEFETGNLTLSIINAEEMGLEHKVVRHEVALHVDDVAAARAALEAQGVSFRGEILDTGVCHMAFFDDPDGNALMLHHRYAPRKSDLG